MANAFLLEPAPFVVAYDGFAAPGHPLDYAGNDYAGVIWRTVPGDNFTVIVDFGRDILLDTILLFGVWGNVTSAAPTVRVALATEEQGPSFQQQNVSDGKGVGNHWLEPNPPALFAGSSTRPDRGVTMWIAPAGVPRPAFARYLYLNFVGLNAGNQIAMARLVAGARIELERNFSFGAGFGVKDLGSLEFSRRGVLLRNRGAKLRTTSLTFSNVRKDEVEALTKPLLERIGNTECIALVTDPSPHAQRQNRCYFGPLVGDLSQTWRRADAWEAKINMVSIF